METPVENIFSDYYQAAERNETKKEIDESDILNPDSEEPSRFEPLARDLTIPQVYWTEWAQNHENLLICNGRVMFGHDWKYLLLTTAFITIPSILYYVFVILHSQNYLSSDFHMYGLMSLDIITLIFLFNTHFTEPGYLPSPQAPDCKWIDSLPDGQKYCVTCRLWRPARAKHCRYCKACVRGSDHHCTWVGACIGERNRRSFFIFLICVTGLVIYIMTCSVYVLYEETIRHSSPAGNPSDFIDAVQRNAIVPFIIAIAMFFTLTVGNLLLFHIYLLATNQTTKEFNRGTYKNDFNPWNKGWMKNCQSILCIPIVDSHILSGSNTGSLSDRLLM